MKKPKAPQGFIPIDSPEAELISGGTIVNVAVVSPGGTWLFGTRDIEVVRRAEALRLPKAHCHIQVPPSVEWDVYTTFNKGFESKYSNQSQNQTTGTEMQDYELPSPQEWRTMDTYPQGERARFLLTDGSVETTVIYPSSVPNPPCYIFWQPIIVPKRKPWRAKKGGAYFIVDILGDVLGRTEDGTYLDNALYKIGNYYNRAEVALEESVRYREFFKQVRTEGERS